VFVVASFLRNMLKQVPLIYTYIVHENQWLKVRDEGYVSEPFEGENLYQTVA